FCPLKPTLFPYTTLFRSRQYRNCSNIDSARFIAFIYTPSLLDYFLFSEYCFRTISIAAIFYHFFPFSPLKSCNLFYSLLNVTLIHYLFFFCLFYYFICTFICIFPLLCLFYYLYLTIIHDLPFLCLIY